MCALLFGLVVYLIYAGHVMIDVGSSSYGTNGSTALIQYYTGYLIEKSLSLDNIFVIALIFQFFKIPNELLYFLYLPIFLCGNGLFGIGLSKKLHNLSQPSPFVRSMTRS